MSWMEVDGAGWRWVHGLVIPKRKKYLVLLLLLFVLLVSIASTAQL